jgi:hypothetical protein
MFVSILSVSVPEEERRLSSLARQFRNTYSDDERRHVAAEYANVVMRLISSDQWDEIPAPEDQLPNEWMPNSFLSYWTQRHHVS